MEKKKMFIECPLYIITAIIIFTGGFYLITNFMQEKKESWFLPVIVTIVGIVIILSAWSLIHYHYFRKGAIKNHQNEYEKFGYDITRLLSWFFSVDALFVYLVAAIVTLIAYVILNEKTVGTELTGLTLTVSLSALIPFLISRIVAKSQLEEIIETKLENELNRFKTSLYNIRKDKGHSSRMSAALLLQNAVKSKSKEEKNKNAIWSIGWASEATIQYLLIKEQYSHAIDRIKECGDYIYDAFSILSLSEKDTIKSENIISVLTMYALHKHFCLGDIINKADIKQIARQLYLHRDKTYDISGSSCRITGMDDEFNRTLESEADEIIRGFSKKIDHI